MNTITIKELKQLIRECIIEQINKPIDIRKFYVVLSNEFFDAGMTPICELNDDDIEDAIKSNEFKGLKSQQYDKNHIKYKMISMDDEEYFIFPTKLDAEKALKYEKRMNHLIQYKIDSAYTHLGEYYHDEKQKEKYNQDKNNRNTILNFLGQEEEPDSDDSDDSDPRNSKEWKDFIIRCSKGKAWNNLSWILELKKDINGKVNVNGNASMNQLKLKKFPVNFGKVDNDFYALGNNFISLKGFPTEVGGDVYINNFTEEQIRSVCKVKGKVYNS